MTEWLLKDEEIENIKDATYGWGRGAYKANFSDRAIAQAQAKKLVEWLFRPCDHLPIGVVFQHPTKLRFQCEECVQELRREVGLEE